MSQGNTCSSSKMTICVYCDKTWNIIVCCNIKIFACKIHLPPHMQYMERMPIAARTKHRQHDLSRAYAEWPSSYVRSEMGQRQTQKKVAGKWESILTIRIGSMSPMVIPWPAGRPAITRCLITMLMELPRVTGLRGMGPKCWRSIAMEFFGRSMSNIRIWFLETSLIWRTWHVFDSAKTKHGVPTCVGCCSVYWIGQIHAKFWQLVEQYIVKRLEVLRTCL